MLCRGVAEMVEVVMAVLGTVMVVAGRGWWWSTVWLWALSPADLVGVSYDYVSRTSEGEWPRGVFAVAFFVWWWWR